MTGTTGTIGNTGSTGATGSSSLDHLFTAKGSPFLILIADGGTVPFDNAVIIEGSSISQTATDTFTFNETGNYYVHFSGKVIAKPPAGNIIRFSILINGAEFPDSQSWIFTPEITLQRIVQITTVPTTLQIGYFNTDGDIGLTNVTISIIELPTSS